MKILLVGGRKSTAAIPTGGRETPTLLRALAFLCASIYKENDNNICFAKYYCRNDCKNSRAELYNNTHSRREGFPKGGNRRFPLNVLGICMFCKIVLVSGQLSRRDTTANPTFTCNSFNRKTRIFNTIFNIR